MQNYVFQLNRNQTPLDMIHPARARELQSKGKAATFRQYPYTVVRSTQVDNPVTKSYILKIDPGSKWTGFAIQCGNAIIFRMELQHRGEVIKLKLQKRAGFRRYRRSQLRYRKARFNRHKTEGWLAPSLKHRVLTIETWIKRFMRYCPIDTIEIEQVRFDTQLMQNPEIDGVDYQHGTLAGTEVREYLLTKWGHKCAYCGAKDVPLEIEHIEPKSRGGSDRVSNLCIACVPCNQKKGNQKVADFLKGNPTLLQTILVQAKAPLKDAAAMNSTRFAIVKMTKGLCPVVKCWTGGRTKFNRVQQGLPKGHSIDAGCVGESGANIILKTDQPLILECKGHGTRQARRVNASGFPAVQKAKETFTHVKAGDIIKVQILKDRKNVKAGEYITRVKTPTRKGCEVLIDGHRIELSSMKNVEFLHRSDGYTYGFEKPQLTPINADL